MIRTFLDASVLIDGARGLAESASIVLSILGDPERTFVSAKLLELEVLPKAIRNEMTAEVEFYQAYFDVCEHVRTDDAMLERAFARAAKLGLSAIDAVHMEVAVSAEVDEFITAENPSKPFYLETALKVRHLRSFTVQ